MGAKWLSIVSLGKQMKSYCYDGLATRMVLSFTFYRTLKLFQRMQKYKVDEWKRQKIIYNFSFRFNFQQLHYPLQGKCPLRFLHSNEHLAHTQYFFGPSMFPTALSGIHSTVVFVHSALDMRQTCSDQFHFRPARRRLNVYKDLFERAKHFFFYCTSSIPIRQTKVN